MSQPLGRAVGNALEIAEALEVLDPQRSVQADTRLKELCLVLAAEGVSLAHGLEPADARRRVQTVLDSGEALARFKALTEAQGGTLDALPTAPVRLPVLANKSGWVTSIAARKIGELVVALGGGRATKDDTIEPAVGVEILAPVGAWIREMELLGVVHAAHAHQAEWAGERLRAAFRLGDAPCVPSALIQDRIG
jgi:thymidine phosphorylase